MSMENKTLSLFNFQNKNVRVFGTHDEPWFVAKDIGEILGLTNIRENIRGLNSSWKKDVKILDTLGGPQKMTLINEASLYKLTFSSKKDEAKAFVEWVCADLLPTLRRTGKYEMENRVKVLEAYNQALQARNSMLEKKQYITDEDDYIMISKRIIEKNYISQEEYDYLMSPCYETIKGRFCKINHPDKSKLRSHLMHLSKQMAKAKNKRDEKYPDIRRKDRRNAYYLNDYKEYGDDIIEAYFKEHPLTSWGIDFTW